MARINLATRNFYAALVSTNLFLPFPTNISLNNILLALFAVAPLFFIMITMIIQIFVVAVNPAIILSSFLKILLFFHLLSLNSLVSLTSSACVILFISSFLHYTSISSVKALLVTFLLCLNSFTMSMFLMLLFLPGVRNSLLFLIISPKSFFLL